MLCLVKFKNFWICFVKLWAVGMTFAFLPNRVRQPSNPLACDQPTHQPTNPLLAGTDCVSQDEIATLAVKHQAVPLWNQLSRGLNQAPEVAFLNLYRDKDGLTPQERRELEA